MKQAEFAELSREVMPVLDKLTEIAGQHGTAEKLVSITLSAEGYIHFTVHDWNVSEQIKKRRCTGVGNQKTVIPGNGKRGELIWQV